MRSESVSLSAVSPGSFRTLTCHVWGEREARPKVYLHGGLHADEMPGPLALWHLMDRLDEAERKGRITGQVAVVPLANPIGLMQWVQNKPQGRQDLETMRNFNRGYPDLAALVGDDLDGVLTDDPDHNKAAIRAAFGAALARVTPLTEPDELRLRLMQWSHDADYVLDLHCDHVAILHLYASGLRPADTELLCRSIGAELALIQDVSGGNAFDEAHTAPWRDLAARHAGRHPIPAGCFSSTLEYRGQGDVDDATAARDAENLMVFLGAVGAVSGVAAPAHPLPPLYPLGGAVEAFAPQGGIVTWLRHPGDRVAAGDTLAHVSDPTTRRRLPVLSPATGILFRRELWPFVMKGQGVCHVAGETILRQGHLLSD